MPNYKDTIIYKICCKDPTIEDIYVGSTCNFKRRKHQHKFCVEDDKYRGSTYKLYQYIRDNGGFENWDMIQIEAYACSNKREKETRERYWIEQLKPKLNGHMPSRDKKQYREEFKEVLKEKKKQEYLENKEKYLERSKQQREEHKEEMKEYHKEYREKHLDELKEKRKQYYEDNKEEFKKKNKQYHTPEKNKEQYLKYKEEILEKRKQKVKCEQCDLELTAGCLKRHIKNIHLNPKEEKPKKTNKEYYEENKDKILKKVHEYKNNHKEEIKQQGIEYREKNRDIISERRKEHYAKNKEAINEKRREQDKTELNLKRKTATVFCEVCKENVNKDRKFRHDKSKKHLANLEL